MAINSSKESTEEESKQTSSTNKQRFIKDFCDNQMNDKSNKNKFLDSIFNDNEKPTDLINTELENGKSKGKEIKGYNSPVSNKYLGVKVEDIKLTDLKNKLGSEYISLKDKRNTLAKIIEGEYDLTENELNKIVDEISNLDEDKLSDFINSNKKQNTFMKKVFGKNMPKYEMDNFPSLYSITETEYNEKLSKINDNSKKQQIKTIFLEFKKGILTDINIKILIKSDFLNTDQKEEIIEKLIPVISLKQIKEFGLVSVDEILKLENDLKIKYSDDLEDLTINEKQVLFNKLNFDDIFIDTLSILNKSNILKISEKIGFSQIEDDFNEYKKEYQKFRENKGLQTFDEFKIKLKEEKIPGIENLKEGSIFKFTVKGDKSYNENYFTIKKDKNDNKSLSMSLIGTKIGIDGKTKVNKEGESNESQKYCDIIDVLDKEKNKNITTLEIFSEDSFDKLIIDKENFEVEINNVGRISKEELEKDENLQEEIRKELEEKYGVELNDLEVEKDDLEKERKSVKNNNTLDSDEKRKKLETLDVKIHKLTLFIADKKGDLLKVNNNVNIEDLVAHKNFNDLVEKIDLLDTDGNKVGLKKGIILETKKGAYEITGIDKENETISLSSSNGIEPNLGYEAFFQAFKENKTKRIKKINSFDELLQENSWNEDYELKNDELIQKNVEFNGKKEDKNIEYLVSEKGDLIKIESIGNGEVEVIFGELSEGKEDRKTKKTVNKISLEQNTTKLSLNELNKLIKDNKFKPDWKVGKNYSIENVDGYKNDINGSFATRFWNRTSFKELYMSGTMLIDGLQEYFKKGNDIKAAEFALKWASFLPEEIEADFIAQTEMKAAEAMEKELTALGKISSSDAFKRVLGWLKNKDTKSEKLEAGLMLAAKYGVLYPKSLTDYNGTFLWYEALGGKIGDEMYEQEKLKAEKAGLPFDEKELLIGLLNAQSKGRLAPKRRSKFYKEFKGKIAGGFGEEYGDGYKDAEDKRNIGDIVDGGFEEVESGTLPNALGWAKKAVEKGGTLKQMNEIYFSLIFSGALLNAPGKVLEELNNHWSGEGNGMILAAFGSDLGGQNIFNKTVVSVSKEIEATDKNKYSGMGKKAQELFDSTYNGSKPYSDRVRNARDFWNTYGDVLSRTLFMADGDEKDVEYSKTDKLIAFGKEDEHKEYFNYVKKWTPQGSAFKKGFMEDDVGPSGVTGLDNYEILKQHFTFTPSRTFKDPTVVNLVWPKIWGDILSIKTKIEKDPVNESKYRKYLSNKLREVSAGLLSSLGKDLYETLAISDPVGLDFSSIGINLDDFKGNRVEDVLKGDDGKDKIFDTAVDNIINGNIAGKGGLGKFSVFGVTDDVQEAVNNTMYNSDEDSDVA